MLIDMETDIITEGARFSKHELQRYETRILYMDMHEHERKIEERKSTEQINSFA